MKTDKNNIFKLTIKEFNDQYCQIKTAKDIDKYLKYLGQHLSSATIEDLYYSEDTITQPILKKTTAMGLVKLMIVKKYQTEELKKGDVGFITNIGALANPVKAINKLPIKQAIKVFTKQKLGKAAV